MKILAFTIAVALMTLQTTCRLTKSNMPRSKKKHERKLYENTSASFMLGDQGTKNSLNHLQMLVNQQKSLQNFKIVGGWLTNLEGKMDDLRDSLNRRLSDMGVGLQRRNSLLGHYAASGSTIAGVGGTVNPYLNF